MKPLTGNPLQVLVFSTAGFAFLLFGYDQGVMGGLVSLPSFRTRFGNPSPGLLGFMVASYDVGCLFGAVLAFLFGDRFGRRKTLIISCCVLIVGATLQTSAFSRVHYIIGRIVAGLGVGAISVTVPIYASECAKATFRGVLVIIETTMVIIGIVLSNFVNYGFVYGKNGLTGKEAQWRIPIALQMMFPFFVFALMPFCIESPRWLAAKGRYNEVYIVLARLEGNGATADSAHIREQGVIIIATAEHESAIEASWKESFTGGELQNFRRLVLSGAAGFMHQATGINVVIYYAPVIFRNIGLTNELAYIMSCVGSICFLIGSVLPILYIERMGRRRVMMMGAALCGTCMGMVACCVGIGAKNPDLKVSAGWAATAFVFLFEFSFGVGWNSMCWLVGSELSSLRMRNKGSSVQCICNWATNFLTVMVTPIGFATLEWRFYLVWMVITLASIPFIYCCYPETAGRTLEQMDYFFAKHQHWNIAKVANEWIDVDSDLLRNTTEMKKEDSVQHQELTV